MTPQDNLAVVLRVLDELRVDQYTRFCTVLTAYAESDFRTDAVQFNATFGVFQQNPKYWPSALLGAEAQCRAFIAAFVGAAAHHNNDPVHDCWVTQRWKVPSPAWPDPGPGFDDAPETMNYSRRLPVVAIILRERTLR